MLTSSFAAIGYGHAQRKEPFAETDWTNPVGSDVSAYVKSKTLAERPAWDFMAREGGHLELSVVNPVGVFGPVLACNACWMERCLARLSTLLRSRRGA